MNNFQMPWKFLMLVVSGVLVDAYPTDTTTGVYSYL